MITKSKLHEIKNNWDKLEKSLNHPQRVRLVNEIISLLDSEDYYEETADFLETTTLKLSHLTELSFLDDEKFLFLLNLADGNLDLCYLFYHFPDEELKKFIKTFKNIKNVEKLVSIAAERLNDLNIEWNVEKENPWIPKLESLAPDVWASLADDSESWIDFSKENTKK